MDEWEDSISERPSFSKTEKGMMLLSYETRMGLRITGLLRITTKFYSKTYNYCESNAFVLFYLFEVADYAAKCAL